MENTSSGGVEPSIDSSVGSSPSSTESITLGSPGPESDFAAFTRLLVDALLTTTAPQLRKDDETPINKTFQEELAAFREVDERLTARLEKAFKASKPEPDSIEPIINFWTVYKEVADEHDSGMVAKYVGDLDTSLLFAGLFSAVTATFVVQILPSVRPNPSDLTNALLLQILEKSNAVEPPVPQSHVPSSAVVAQSILFASLVITLFVAFIAVIGKQWLLYYTRVSTWGSIINRGKERQAKFAGLRKWGFHFVTDSLPVLLQFALFLFSVGLTVFLWDIQVSSAEVVLAVASLSLAFYVGLAVASMIWDDCPFQTPLSVLLPKGFGWMKKKFAAISRLWLRHRLRRRSTALPTQVEPGPKTISIDQLDPRWGIYNLALWRDEPLFTPLPPQDTSALAAIWLLENSTGFSTVAVVAAVFSEFQWPSHNNSPTVLFRLRDAYMECFRQPKFDESVRLKAVQIAVAYYILYQTQLIWTASRSFQAEKIPSDLPFDLFLSKHDGKWEGYDLFEYLLQVEIRSESAISARSLSYIAPYWFCGDINPSIRFRPSHLDHFDKITQVLEASDALTPTTFTECVLSAGAMMDFPLHPEDLIRVDKSDYLQQTFKAVVEHIYGTVSMGRSHRIRYAPRLLRIIHTLIKKKSLVLIDGAWVDVFLRGLAGCVIKENKKDEIFTQFLRLRSLGEEVNEVAETTVPSETLAQEGILFGKILMVINACSEREEGWNDEAVYGGLAAIKGIVRSGSHHLEVDFFRMLCSAMEKGEGEGKPTRVRETAYDIVQALRDGWLGASAELRQTLQDNDLPRRLHSVVNETSRSNQWREFFLTIETLSDDKNWHSYLRGAMDIWVFPYGEKRGQVVRILANVIEASVSDVRSLDAESLVSLVKDEWSRVQGRAAEDLTADRLAQFSEVTKKLRQVSFREEEKKSILAVVEQVIPSLENRFSDRVGEDVRGIIDDLIIDLQKPMGPSNPHD